MPYPDQLQTPQGRQLLAALRGMSAHLPEVTEVIDGFGHNTFKVRARSFIIAGMGNGATDIAIKADPTSQAILIRHGPWRRTPYIGHHGWISLENPLDHDRAELAALIEDAYRLAAPKTLTARLD